MLLLLAVWTGAGGGPLPAAGAAPQVDLTPLGSRPVILAELLSHIEYQTGLKFEYAPGQLPLGAEVVVEPAGPMAISRLLALVSAQTGLGFQLADQRILVATKPASPAPVAMPARARPALAAEEIAAAPRAAPRTPPAVAYAAAPRSELDPRLPAIALQPALEPGPVPAAPPEPLAMRPPASAGLVARVDEIARSAQLSVAAKEKLISGEVRAAVTVAALQSRTTDEVLGAALALAEAAAGAAPRFVDVIAGAAAFTPGVARINQGSSRIRAAAYAAARAAGK